MSVASFLPRLGQPAAPGSFTSLQGPARARPRREQGITLIELMVGITIGLLAVLVITQVALVYEGQKRSTTAGMDAQVNGALVLQALTREIQRAGYGVATGGGAGCTLNGKRGTVVPPWHGEPMVPVRILNANGTATGNSDTLRLLRSDASSASLPIRLVGDARRDDTTLVVDPKTNLGYSAGDLMVIVPVLPTAGTAFATPCTVFGATADPSGNTIVHDTGTTGIAPWNHDNTDPIFPGTTSTSVAYTGNALTAASQIINLGGMVYQEYAIAANTTAGSDLQLRSASATTGTWGTAQRLYPDIINLQAVYGRDTTTAAPGPYGSADTWDTTEPTTPDGWARVIAIRIAVVARSQQFERDEVTTAQPTWTPDGVNPTTLQVNHLSDWRHYRYRVYETVVPLRNMLWQS